MKFLSTIQRKLEESYGAHTGVDVRDFTRAVAGLTRRGQLVVEQDGSDDINLALLLDRDILSAWQPNAHGPLSALEISVPFEEVSHFVYLAWNHARGRNVTTLEMEMQSEVDRILLAFHGGLGVSPDNGERLLTQLLDKSYDHGAYETARVAAAQLVRRLCGGDPRAWAPKELKVLREFFHSDLTRKFEISRGEI